MSWPATDPISLMAALVAVFAIASLVWWLIALGLREAMAACCCLAGANALLGGSIALHRGLALLPPEHGWVSDLLSLAAFGLVRLAVPLLAERAPPWRGISALVVACGLLLSQLDAQLQPLAHKTVVYGGPALLCLLTSLDTWRQLRLHQLRAGLSALLALPMGVVALLLAARPLELLLHPGQTLNLAVSSGFNIAWLWATLLLNLTLNSLMAFLLLMKLVLRIRQLTRRDPLTETLNRRALSEVLELEHGRYQRGHGYALVMLDMDRFKQLNDTLGHAAGDAALKDLVEVIRPCLREVDLLGRLGGEEFCALLPDTDIAGAALVAERMRAVLQDHMFEWLGQHWPLTASFGIAESSPGDASAAEVLKRADQALYRAKAQGRNLVQAVERG